MNVGQLMQALSKLDPNLPVVLDAECGLADDIRLYLIPAHRDRYGSIGDRHVNPTTDWGRKIYAGCTNLTALHISGWGCGDDAEDITPDIRRPGVVDGEAWETKTLEAK